MIHFKNIYLSQNGECPTLHVKIIIIPYIIRSMKLKNTILQHCFFTPLRDISLHAVLPGNTEQVMIKKNVNTGIKISEKYEQARKPPSHGSKKKP